MSSQPQFNILVPEALFLSWQPSNVSPLSFCELLPHRVEWDSLLAATHYYCDRRAHADIHPPTHPHAYIHMETQTHTQKLRWCYTRIFFTAFLLLQYFSDYVSLICFNATYSDHTLKSLICCLNLKSDDTIIIKCMVYTCSTCKVHLHCELALYK